MENSFRSLSALGLVLVTRSTMMTHSSSSSSGSAVYLHVWERQFLTASGDISAVPLTSSLGSSELDWTGLRAQSEHSISLLSVDQVLVHVQRGECE